MSVPRELGEPLLVAVARGLGMTMSPYTVSNYVHYLRHLFTFLQARGITDVGRVRAEDLEAFRQQLSEIPTRFGRPPVPSSLNKCTVAIKAMYRWLHAVDAISYNPAARIELARQPRRLPRVILTPAEATRMCEAPDAATTLGVRDRVALELLYGAALRRNELLQLDVDAVSVAERVVRVEHGKGGKGRVVPFGAPAADVLGKYLQWVRPELALRRPRERALLLSWRGGRLDPQTLAVAVASAGVAAGVGKRVTPHALRHACATHMLENGADIRYLQELLGHESLNSTQVYTHLSLRHLRETYARCHPRERAAATEPPEDQKTV